MENLQSELKSVQGVVTDILHCIGGDLAVSSWKFPERLAASVDPQELLKERENEGLGDTKMLLLELLVDRLLFLFQCCVRFSEMSQSQRSTSLPLTLGSAVKKFSRKFQQDHSTLKYTKEQLCVRDERIVSLESTIADLQAAPVEQVPTTSDPEQPPDTVTKVPYEALGTMKINRLSSSVDLLTRELSKTTNPETVKPSKIASPEIVKPSKTTIPETIKSPPIVLAPQCASVSTQTTETGFALCLRCSDTHRVLVELAQSVSGISASHNLSSSLSSVDWAGLAKVGGLEIVKWEECFSEDLKSLSGRAVELEDKVQELCGLLEGQRAVTVNMVENTESLTAQISSLQTAIEEVRESGAESLANAQHELGEQLGELGETCSLLESANSRVKEELSVSRRQEATLKSRLADIEYKRAELQGELQSLHGREMTLLSSQQTLKKELEVATVEKSKFKEQFEQSQLELAKTRRASQSMEKKNKALVSKQSSLLLRLDELDVECGVLRGQLCEVEKERQALSEEVINIHSQCQQLRGELDIEKENLSRSLVEDEQLRALCSELEEQVQDTKERLEEESERCRLLMDYPFVKQTSERYVQHITSMSAYDSQRQISANTVRILLLEEQNSELREKEQREMQERGATSGGQVYHPVRTWRDGLLSQVHCELSTAKEASAKLHSNERALPSDLPQSHAHRPSSSGAYRGRLGHLVTAITDHRSSVKTGHSTKNN